eukprot:GDKH01014897.1.p2 GENE.GDKH01014897.1~~GDKH01014897.1.p2  ORF type:complete len:566 (+),score=176.84 GDKH01014897.1:91-1788(+)
MAMPTNIVDLNEKRIERLPARELARELMRLPAKKRMDLILERPDSESVVAAMDANDLFFTIQEIGPDDSLPVLGLASPEQVDHIFDLEWWRKDAIEPARALTWLERLSKASSRKLVDWISHADFELLVSFFKEWITVGIPPEETDMLEARESLPPRTLDDMFFWEAKYPQFDDLVMRLLTVIFETSYGFFKELMNGVLYAVREEAEEDAYRFHTARLADHAVPDFYDALRIYTDLGANEPGKVLSPRRADEEEAAAPSLALALLPEADLLGRVLKRVESADVAEALQFELASLGNKVIVADQVPLDNAAALRSAVEKALAYVNLGLEIRSEGNEDKALEIIGNTFLEHLFRLAQAEVAGVRGRAAGVVRSGWLAQCPSGLKCLDGVWFEAAEELLAKTPKLRRAGEAGSGTVPGFDFFRTPRDIAHGNHVVDVIIGAGRLYTAVNADFDPAALQLWSGGQVSAPEDITLGVMILTAAAQKIINGKWAVAPIALGEWPDAFARLAPGEIDRVVMDWAYEVEPDGGKRRLAEAYLSPLLRDYDSEMGRYSAANRPEPEFVPFFMFRE